MNIYIPQIDFNSLEKRNLFIATRPFLVGLSWGNDTELKKQWQIHTSISYTNNISEANVIFLPYPINDYPKSKLQKINDECRELDLQCYGFISGDYGDVFPYFDRLTYFRVGGFRSQLPINNIGLPVALSDIYKSLYRGKSLQLRSKQKLPTVGFCGHASSSFLKRWRDKLSFIKKNTTRFFKNPFTNDFEPIFSSAYERFKLLKVLEVSSIVETNFIYRNSYRAGADTKEKRVQTTKEYYENIRKSDYVLCVRGSGNFSVRLYETLMMGRIPIFVDTDCLLPFVEEIDWHNHIVWVPWKNRNEIAQIISNFHKSLDDEKFYDLQRSNRLLWENLLSLTNIFEYIRKKNIKT